KVSEPGAVDQIGGNLARRKSRIESDIEDLVSFRGAGHAEHGIDFRHPPIYQVGLDARDVADLVAEHGDLKIRDAARAHVFSTYAGQARGVHIKAPRIDLPSEGTVARIRGQIVCGGDDGLER